MGDVAMTVPVLRALVNQNKYVKITVVSRPFFKPFFEGIERVDFFAVDINKRHKGFIGIYQLFKDLKHLSIDQVADLHNVLRSKILRTFFKLSGKNIAFTDKGRADKKALTRADNKVFAPVKSMFDRHVETFQRLGYVINLKQIENPETSEIHSKVKQLTGSREGFHWIGIAPFAQYQTKVYPLDLMAETIVQLSKNSSYKIFLFGGGSEEIYKLNQLQQNLENVVVVAGKINFKEELELIQNLDLMLSMDSGNAHIAAMYGKKVMTLWGHTHPYAGFVPFGQPMNYCITSNRVKYPLLPTSVYGNKQIEGYENVMRTIKPETIVNKIKEII